MKINNWIIVKIDFEFTNYNNAVIWIIKITLPILMQKKKCFYILYILKLSISRKFNQYDLSLYIAWFWIVIFHILLFSIPRNLKH